MSSEQTLAFIEDYRSHSALWDIRDKDYTNKLKRTDAHTVLATKYGMTVKGVKNKIKIQQKELRVLVCLKNWVSSPYKHSIFYQSPCLL
jgi:hypothetical protein